MLIVLPYLPIVTTINIRRCYHGKHSSSQTVLRHNGVEGIFSELWAVIVYVIHHNTYSQGAC